MLCVVLIPLHPETISNKINGNASRSDFSTGNFMYRPL